MKVVQEDIHFKWRPRHRVVLVGPDAEIAELKEKISSPVRRMDILATCGAEQAIGVLQNLKHVDVVYCSLTELPQHTLLSLSQYCENKGVKFCVMPMLLSTIRRKHRVSYIGTSIVLTARKEPLAYLFNRAVKRVIDLLVSGVFLFLIFPVVYVVMAFLIKHKTHGPVFVMHQSQRRDGESFSRLNFQTHEIMRPTFIDVLPEFINVFMGQMSLVGPSPMSEDERRLYDAYYNKYTKRIALRPGLTGWSQQLGVLHGDVTQQVKSDIWYAENWSPWLDLRIMLKSLF